MTYTVRLQLDIDNESVDDPELALEWFIEAILDSGLRGWYYQVVDNDTEEIVIVDGYGHEIDVPGLAQQIRDATQQLRTVEDVELPDGDGDHDDDEGDEEPDEPAPVEIASSSVPKPETTLSDEDAAALELATSLIIGDEPPEEV